MVKHQLMEHILAQRDLLAPETERSLSQYGRVTFSREILSPQQHFYEKNNHYFLCINLVPYNYYIMNTAIQSSSSF